MRVLDGADRLRALERAGPGGRGHWPAPRPGRHAELVDRPAGLGRRSPPARRAPRPPPAAPRAGLGRACRRARSGHEPCSSRSTRPAPSSSIEDTRDAPLLPRLGLQVARRCARSSSAKAPARSGARGPGLMRAASSSRAPSSCRPPGSARRARRRPPATAGPSARRRRRASAAPRRAGSADRDPRDSSAISSMQAGGRSAPAPSRAPPRRSRSWAKAPSRSTCAASSSAPGVAQVDARAAPEHVGGELGAEVGAGDRGAARQPHAPSGDSRLEAAGRSGGLTFDAVGRPVATEPTLGRACRHRRRASASASRAGTADCRRCAGPAPARAAPALELGDAERIDQVDDLRRRRAAAARLQARPVRAEQRVVEATAPPGPARRGRKATIQRRPSAGAQPAAARPRRWPRRRTAGRRRTSPATPSASAWRSSRLERVDEAHRCSRSRRGRRPGPSSGSRCASSVADARAASGPRDAPRAAERSSRDSSACGTRASPGRASTDHARRGRARAKSPTRRVLPRPASPADQARLRRPPRPACERLPLGVAADQARRPQHADRQRSRRRRTGSAVLPASTRARSASVSASGATPRSRSQDVAAAIERGQRRRPVAAQVVQAHQAAMAVLGGRIGSPAGCSAAASAGGQPAARFRAAMRCVGQGADACAVAAPLARLAPASRPARWHRRSSRPCSRLAADGRVGADRRSDLDDRRTGPATSPAFEQLAAERAAQAEQALAQVGAGAFGDRRRARVSAARRLARRRPFERQVGEQQRVLLLDRDDRAIGAYELRLVGEIERSGADGGLGHGRGREILEAKAQGASISELRRAA